MRNLEFRDFALTRFRGDEEVILIGVRNITGSREIVRIRVSRTVDDMFEAFAGNGDREYFRIEGRTLGMTEKMVVSALHAYFNERYRRNHVHARVSDEVEKP